MTSKHIILIIAILFIVWGLCKSKQIDQIKIKKIDRLFTIISVVICVVLTILGTCIHLTDHLWFLLLPTIAISSMCIFTGTQKKHEPVQVYSVVEKILMVSGVVLLCSGIAECSYLFPLKRFTYFFTASMFYKMLGGWILAELVFCHRFPVALVKAFFLIVFIVNVVRLIDVLWFHSIYRDGTYPLIQMAISLAVVIYMYYRSKVRSKIERS